MSELTPVEVHAAALERVERDLKGVAEVEWYLMQPVSDRFAVNTALESLGGIEEIRAGLDGRRRILQRHTPELRPYAHVGTEYGKHWQCRHCTVDADGGRIMPWPCPDWRDAAGLQQPAQDPQQSPTPAGQETPK